MMVVDKLKMSTCYSACNSCLQKNKAKIVRVYCKEIINAYHTCKREGKEIYNQHIELNAHHNKLSNENEAIEINLMHMKKDKENRRKLEEERKNRSRHKRH